MPKRGIFYQMKTKIRDIRQGNGFEQNAGPSKNCIKDKDRDNLCS